MALHDDAPPAVGDILARLLRLMQRLNHGQSFEHSVHLVAQAARALCACQGATLWVLDESGIEPLLQDPQNPEHPGVPLREGWVGWAFEQDEPAWFENTQYLPRHENEVYSDRVGALVAVPIVLARERLGVLVLAFDEVTPFSREHLSRAELLAYSAAACLERARHRPVDPGTGLLRRDILIPRLRQEMDRNLGASPALAVLVLGFDRLSAVGDSREQVLQAMVRRIRERVRERDPIALYTQDRFVLLLPGATAQVALIAAERIRESMTEAIVLEDQQSVRQTASVGLASWDGRISARELLRRSTAAQQQAFSRGGNAVMIDSS